MQDRRNFDFCLLIPCYNNSTGLVDSLKSIKYRDGDYLIVIIDDGSSVAVSNDELKEVRSAAHSIVILRNEDNQGITFSLNKGLKWILSNTTCKYIARLDCGDICTADRFFKQVQFLDTHSTVGLLGSWVRFCEPDGSSGFNYTTPVHHQPIIRSMHFRNVFIHPSVMIRRDVLEKNNLYYPDNFPHAEDYAFFWSILRISQSHILNEFLVVCEINKNGISFKNRGKQLVSRFKVVRAFGNSGFLKFLSYFCLAVLRLTPPSILVKLKKIYQN